MSCVCQLQNLTSAIGIGISWGCLPTQYHCDVYTAQSDLELATVGLAELPCEDEESYMRIPARNQKVSGFFVAEFLPILRLSYQFFVALLSCRHTPCQSMLPVKTICSRDLQPLIKTQLSMYTVFSACKLFSRCSSCARYALLGSVSHGLGSSSATTRYE